MYDKEFEEFWDNSVVPFKTQKDFAYLIWQSARAPKPKQETIELKGGEWSIPGDLYVFHEVTRKNYRDSGHERKTEEDAKKAAEAMRKRDRLAAFVYEHCGYEGEWIKGNCNCYIYLFYETYKYNIEDCFPDLCKQYMPEATAKWLCEKLNSSKIVL